MTPSLSDVPELKTVIAINGFLGLASDWDLIRDLLPAGWTLHTIDLWGASNIVAYDEWAERIAEEIGRTFSIDTPKILLGYSMGGRLAMNLLAHSPKLFSGAVIVSANPGLLSEAERLARREADTIWATKFLKEPWPNLIQEWNAQAALREPKVVDSDSIVLDRKESEFDRFAIANALRTWTLGAQRNLRPEIALLALPIKFITGEDDVKFTALARDLVKEPANGARTHEIVSRAGHRVPWDAPAQFRSILANFLARW